MKTQRTITLTKRMAASKCTDENGQPIQYLGSGYINRWNNGKGCSCSPDAAFVSNMLPDLTWEECEIDVDCTISLDPFDGAREMWCFGRRVASRAVSPHKPTLIKEDNGSEERDRADSYIMKGSFFYLDGWCDNSYFCQHPAGAIFPVYVLVERKSPKEA